MPMVPSNNPNTNQRSITWLIIVLASGIIALLIACILWLKPKDAVKTANPLQNDAASAMPSGELPSNQTVTLAHASSVSANATHLPTSLPKSLPKSLQGTQVDGEIIIDENKQLVVTAGLRRLFDYFLSAQGEEPLTQIEQRVIAYIREHTPEPAASQAVNIFQNYLTYLTAVSQLDKPKAQQNPNVSALDLSAIKNQLRAVQQLQARYFDAKTREAFFGDEQALNDYNMTVVEANQNAQLSNDQRQAIIDKAQTAYIASVNDPNLQTKLTQQRNIDKLLAQTQQMQQQGATQSQINAMRSQYVSPEAVKRLEQLDQSEAQFAQRVATYQTQSNQILSKLGNVPQAQQQIVALQQTMFTPEEQLRLDVLTDKAALNSLLK